MFDVCPFCSSKTAFDVGAHYACLTCLKVVELHPGSSEEEGKQMKVEQKQSTRIKILEAIVKEPMSLNFVGSAGDPYEEVVRGMVSEGLIEFKMYEQTYEITSLGREVLARSQGLSVPNPSSPTPKLRAWISKHRPDVLDWFEEVVRLEDSGDPLGRASYALLAIGFRAGEASKE